VKLHLGAHIDGFASVAAETLVVGATPDAPVTGRRADAIKAAWTAAEAAMRVVKVGNKNWQVTETVAKVTAVWDTKPVEGELVFLRSMVEKNGGFTICTGPHESRGRKNWAFLHAILFYSSPGLAL